MSLLSPPRRPLLMPAWSRNDLWRRAAAVPSLDLNFAVTKNIGPLVTFTRASTATFIDSAGVLQTAATNEPRFDHNPTTGESLGLLIEEQRTNSIRNNTMQGAVAGTPGTLPTNWAVSGLGTLTQTVVGTGTQNGINYIDIRFSGTTSTTQVSVRFEPSNGVAGTNGQTFAFSAWAARVGGSTSNIGEISANANIYDAGPAFLTSLAFSGYPVTVSTTLTRLSGAGTIASATAAFIQPQIYVNFASGVAIDITLRIGLPQLEQGAFATSVIPTTTAAATRSADVASITGTDFSSWYRQDEGTVFADVNSAPVNTIAQLTFDISEGAGNERMFQRRSGNGMVSTAVIDNGATQGDIGSVVIGASARYRSGFAYKLNDLEIVVNDSGSATDTSATMPTPDRLHIGQNYASGQSCNGTLRRLTFWPSRLPGSTLQQITQ